MTGLLLIAAAIGIAAWWVSSRTPAPPEGPTFDFSSLLPAGLPDPGNPCIVLQEHLEATRRGSYRRAYAQLSAGLRNTTSYEQFAANARANELLFKGVAGYRCETWDVEGDEADAVVFVEYGAGGRSRAEARFSRDNGGWKIDLVTVIYQ